VEEGIPGFGKKCKEGKKRMDPNFEKKKRTKVKDGKKFCVSKERRGGKGNKSVGERAVVENGAVKAGEKKKKSIDDGTKRPMWGKLQDQAVRGEQNSGEMSRPCG